MARTARGFMCSHDKDSMNFKIRRLASEVIMLAVRDVRSDNKRLSKRAEAWLLTEGFEDWCFMVDQSPLKIRRGIYEGGKLKP